MRRSMLTTALAAAALTLAGCGDASEGLLTARQADRLTEAVDAADRAIEDGRCSDARSAARRGQMLAEGLPERVDADVRDTIERGFAHLLERIQAECERPEPAETPTPTPTPTAPPVETPTPEPTPTETAEPVPTPTPTAEPTTEPTPAPTPPSGGVSPPDDGGTE